MSDPYIPLLENKSADMLMWFSEGWFRNIYIYIIYSYITKYELKPAAEDCEHLFFKKHLIRR